MPQLQHLSDAQILIASVFSHYNTAYGQRAAENFYKKLCTTIPSTGRYGLHAFVVEQFKMRKWVDERKIQRLTMKTVPIENVDFELTVGVKRTDYEDNDRLGLIKDAVTRVGASAGCHWDNLMATTLQGAHEQLAFDGQNFFDTSHPTDPTNPASSTFDNKFTTMPLTHANYEARRAYMRGILAPNGKPVGIRTKYLVVPPQLEATGKRILEQDSYAKFSGGAGAEETNVNKGTAELVVIDHLANDATTWYLLGTDVETKTMNAFVHQLRQDVQFAAMFDPTNPHVFMLNEFLFGASARGEIAGLWPQLACRCEA